MRHLTKLCCRCVASVSRAVQFDSLRRAKHSSMMVLYHLHNPEAPAFSSTCNFCNVEIEPGTGLRCTVCTDFDMCRNCKAAGMQHEHPMVVSGRVLRLCEPGLLLAVTWALSCDGCHAQSGSEQVNMQVLVCCWLSAC